jgi:hypothetical protein
MCHHIVFFVCVCVCVIVVVPPCFIRRKNCMQRRDVCLSCGAHKQRLSLISVLCHNHLNLSALLNKWAWRAPPPLAFNRG